MCPTLVDLEPQLEEPGCRNYHYRIVESLGFVGYSCLSLLTPPSNNQRGLLGTGANLVARTGFGPGFNQKVRLCSFADHSFGSLAREFATKFNDFSDFIEL